MGRLFVVLGGKGGVIQNEGKSVAFRHLDLAA
jgi:hypothetical protein